MVNAPILCSADPRIKPWPEDQLSWQRFSVVLLGLSRNVSR